MAELGAFDYYFDTMKEHLDASTMKGKFIKAGLMDGSVIGKGGELFLPNDIQMEGILGHVRSNIGLNGPASFEKLVEVLRSNNYQELANGLEGKLGFIISLCFDFVTTGKCAELQKCKVNNVSTIKGNLHVLFMSFVIVKVYNMILY